MLKQEYKNNLQWLTSFVELLSHRGSVGLVQAGWILHFPQLIQGASLGCPPI